MRPSIKIGRLSRFAISASLFTLLITSCASIIHEDPKKHDAEILADEATSTRSKEALAWLQTNDGVDRSVGKDDPLYIHAQSLEFVLNLYRLGAVNVEAINITPEGAGYGDARTLIITMPSDELKRKNLLKCVNAISTDDGFDADADDGQKYEMAWWS